MKRRVEDTAKVEGVLTPQSLHNQRSPHTVSSLVQTSYPTQGVKPGGNPEVGALAQYSLQSNYTMPSIATNIKSQSGGHTGILVQSHIRHNKVGGGATSPAVGPGVPTGGGAGPGGGTTPGATGAPQFQRLKVEDALSYLDQVKYKFNSQPQVYNDFLEIMKEFKSQCIDTPGVIARVSHLFKGYPELISGFNTFLPPGYKIEVQANDTGYSLQVSVSNPLGHHTMTEIPPLTPTQPQSVVVANQQNKPPSSVYGGVSGSALMSSTGPVHVKGNDRGNAAGVNPAGGLVGTVTGTASTIPMVPTPPTANSTPVHPVTQGNHQVPPSTPTGPPGVTSSNSGPPPGSGPSSQPVEFNHAINYVNKIKNRFQGQPEKYKKFLEILHTYQKEQRNVKEGGGVCSGGKHLTEAEVYSQVAQLFENHDDLLVEFGQFLPDATSHNSLSLANLGSKMNDRKGANAMSMKYQSGRGNESSRVSSGSDVRGSSGDGIGSSKKGSPPGGGNHSGGGGKCSGGAGSGVGGGGGVGVKRSASELYAAATAGAVAASSHSPVPSGSASSTGHHHRHHHHHHHHSTSSSSLPTPIKRQKLQQSTNLTQPISFESIKRQLRNPHAYDNLLRCCHLFNLEILSRCELLILITPLLSRCPDVLAWFKEMLGRNDSSSNLASTPNTSTTTTGGSTAAGGSGGGGSSVGGSSSGGGPGAIGGLGGGGNNSSSPPPQTHHSQASCTPILPIGGTPPSPLDHQLQLTRPIPHDTRPDLLTTASTADIDFSTCKRIGASYCALPKHIPPPKCSGRNFLCKQVLNDTWVSFPTWSEDSTFVTSRKTQYEEYIYRCEDERFELDLVIESNAATIRVLEGVQKKMSRLSPEELSKFRLDDTLGGSSPTIHIRAIKRIYGEKAVDIIEGLKKHPSVAVPIVLKRLKGKEIEWRQAQKGFNKTWREQNEKFYLKSLDHQGINFKQNDLKALRSKSLFSEIEMAYDERNENEDGKNGPHMVLTYCDRSVLDDAANLLIHHVKRQTTIHKQDKTRIKQLLRHFLPDLFHHPRQELSDDERDSNDEKIEVDGNATNKENNGPSSTNSNSILTSSSNNNNKLNEHNNITVSSRTHNNNNNASGSLSSESAMNNNNTTNGGNNVQIKQENDNDRVSSQSNSQYLSDEYTLFYGNNSWYLFLRLHQILCERLAKMLERSNKISEEEAANRVNRKESTAVALRLKPNEHCQDCYAAMLDMVKSVLDCSMDPTTFEDTLRNMFGIHAYIGFTLDRIVTYAVRQLQQLVSEETCVECYRLHTKFKAKGGSGGRCSDSATRQSAEAAYHRAATTALAGDNCYKIYIYKEECKVTVELLDSENEEDENGDKGNSAQNNSAQQPSAQSAAAKWDEYLDSINANDKMKANDRGDSWSKKAVYLHRNLKRWSKNKHTSDNSSNKIDDSSNVDHSQCLFQATNDKILYVANSCVLYRKGAFTRAKQSHCRISRRKYTRFERWHGGWAKGNVTRELAELCRSWLIGRGPATIGGDSSTTKLSTIVRTLSPNDTSPPYRQYSKYSVQLQIQQPSSMH